MSTPAEQLEGLTLDSGWYVEKLLARSPSQTGGCFSSAYQLSKSNGERAFLKAMDFEAALLDPDPAAALKELTDAYLFEREIVELCGNKKLSRIVRAIGSGKVISKPSAGGPGKTVQYLIFELAEGDLRQALSTMTDFDLAWTLKCLHEIFVGVQQLHTNGIAHQDIKPSNVLGCGDQGAKLADLGRAWHPGISAPHDSLMCAGALSYAAPELLYRDAVVTEEERRFGADFYLLGSMVVFMFSGMRTTASLMSCLSPAHVWTNWTGTYDEVLPYLEHGFAEMLELLRLSIPSPELWNAIRPIVQQMCDPDIRRRGDALQTAKIGSRFQLQRLVSRLYVLSMQAKIGKLKAA